MQTKAYAQGMRLYFDQVNRRGGVHGERLKLVTADDRGVPETTVEQTRTLLQDYKPVALAGYFGNRNLRHLLDSQLLAQHRISVVGFQSTDMQVLNAPQMFSTRAGPPQELEKLPGIWLRWGCWIWRWCMTTVNLKKPRHWSSWCERR